MYTMFTFGQCFGAEPNNRTAPLRGAKNLRAPWRRAPAKKTHVLRSAEQKILALRSSAPERKSAPEQKSAPVLNIKGRMHEI